MYSVAVVGNDAIARAALLACKQAGFTQLSWYTPEQPQAHYPATTLSANLSRLVQALGDKDQIDELAYKPDREQVRFAQSGYLLSELPLGAFVEDRYGAPHINLTQASLLELLPSSLPTNNYSHTDLPTLENKHDLVLVSHLDEMQSDQRESLASSHSHELWYSELPFEPAMAKANITWLNGPQTAWQFASPSAMHFYWVTPVQQPLTTDHWHPRLHDALAAAKPLQTFSASTGDVRRHMYAGRVVYLGDAAYQGNVYLREAMALGLEDVWVLSRMMENYEEDINDGLAEFQKYRRPRADRVMRQTSATADKLGTTQATKRFWRNLNHAFSTRFMPEIAMQRIDWLYQYDCIRGFR